MDITTSTTATGTVLRLVGRFDAHEVPAFRDACAAARRTTPAGGEVVVDLSQVVFLDSAALAQLVVLVREGRAGGHDVALLNPSVPVRVILELTGLDLALPVRQGARGAEDEP